MRIQVCRSLIAALIIIAVPWVAIGAEQTADEKRAQKSDAGWVSLFDGKSLDGWRANENADSWRVEDGAIVAGGQRSHLYYAGDVNQGQFKINGETTVDYTEPDDLKRPERQLSQGTFALQAHDPGSKVLFRKLRVKVLP